jgi:Protein of unknown function (DUF2612)
MPPEFVQEVYGYQSYSGTPAVVFPFNTYGSYNQDWPWLTYDTSVQDVINYYVSLLIIQYFGLRKATSTVYTLVDPVVMDLVPQQVENGFDVATAVGSQLDILGTYVGVTRSGNTGEGFVTLDDDEFRQFVQMAVVRCSTNASLYSVQTLLQQFFPDEVFVFDHEDMRISYFVASDGITRDTALLFVSEGLLPKPTGVQLSAVVYAPLVVLESFFGCRTYAAPAFRASPLNSYSDYHDDFPFLSYADIL